MENVHGPLVKRTEACHTLFTKCLSNKLLMRDGWIENRCADFSLWASGIGGFKPGHASLDYRLRNRQDIQDVINDLLEELQARLEQCWQYSDNTPSLALRTYSPGPKSSSESSSSSDSGSVSPWSQISTDDLADRDHEVRFASNAALDEAARRCDTILDQLNRLSLAIRRSGARSRYQKADRTLDITKYGEFTKHLTFITLSSIYEESLLTSLRARMPALRYPSWQDFTCGYSPSAENICLLPSLLAVVQGRLLDPSRLTPVQSRLIRANVIRRNRFLYAKENDVKSNTSYDNFPQPIKPKELTPGGESYPKALTIPWIDPKPIAEPALEFIKEKTLSREETSSKSATDIGSQFVLPRAVSIKAPSAVTRISTTGARLDYPHPPLITDARKTFQCPYCRQTLPTKYAEKGWLGHVMGDIRPYVCIFDPCSKANELFASTVEWMQHMEEEHAARRWLCSICTPSEVFESVEDFENHMKSVRDHADTFTPPQLTILAEMNCRILPVEFENCPLCRWSENKNDLSQTLHDHVAKHLHSFALRSLPWEHTGGDTEKSSDAQVSVKNNEFFESDLDEGDEQTSLWHHPITTTKDNLHRELALTQGLLEQARERTGLRLFGTKIHPLSDNDLRKALLDAPLVRVESELPRVRHYDSEFSIMTVIVGYSEIGGQVMSVLRRLQQYCTMRSEEDPLSWTTEELLEHKNILDAEFEVLEAALQKTQELRSRLDVPFRSFKPAAKWRIIIIVICAWIKPAASPIPDEPVDQPATILPAPITGSRFPPLHNHLMAKIRWHTAFEVIRASYRFSTIVNNWCGNDLTSSSTVFFEMSLRRRTSAEWRESYWRRKVVTHWRVIIRWQRAFAVVRASIRLSVIVNEWCGTELTTPSMVIFQKLQRLHNRKKLDVDLIPIKPDISRNWRLALSCIRGGIKASKILNTWYGKDLVKPSQVLSREVYHAPEPGANFCPYCSLIHHFFRVLDTTLSLRTFPYHVSIEAFWHSVSIGCRLCRVFSPEVPKSNELNYDRMNIIFWSDDSSRQLGLSFNGAIPKVTFDICCSWDEPLPLLRWTSARKPFSNLRSEAALNVMQNWYETCIETHSKCKLHSSVLPTRVLAVGPEFPVVCVVNTASEEGRFAMLSWPEGGNSPPLMLNKETLAKLSAGVVFEALPQMIRDAIKITRKHGIRFLWVDTLCILQDSVEDYFQESNKFAYYYGQSSLIMDSATEGVLLERSRDAELAFHTEYTFAVHETHGEATPYFMWKSSVSLRKSLPSNWDSMTAARTLIDPNNFQAQVLACRTIQFGSSRLLWNCRTESHSEISTAPERSLWDERFSLGNLFVENEPVPREKVYDAWKSMVTYFSGLFIKSHFLPISYLSGVAKAVSRKLPGDSYQAGHWSGDIIKSLLWHKVGEMPPRIHDIEIPSWSWASPGRPITFDMLILQSGEKDGDDFPATLREHLDTILVAETDNFTWTSIISQPHSKDKLNQKVELCIWARHFRLRDSKHSEFSHFIYDNERTLSLNKLNDVLFLVLTYQTGGVLVNYSRMWNGLLVNKNVGEDSYYRVGIGLISDSALKRVKNLSTRSRFHLV